MSDYPIRVGPRSRLFLRFFCGVRPGHDTVRLGDGVVEIRFGWFNPRVPVAQIERYRIEGPWRWITAIGTPRGRGPPAGAGDFVLRGGCPGRGGGLVLLRWSGSIRLRRVVPSVSTTVRSDNARQGFGISVAAERRGG